MAFPRDLLADDEEILIHTRSHWRRLIEKLAFPALALPFVGVIWVLAESQGLDATLLRLLWVVVMFILAFNVGRAVLGWSSIHIVLTSEQVLLREGIFTSRVRSIPLAQIAEVAVVQSPLGKLFRTGDVEVDSSAGTMSGGDPADLVLDSVPNVKEFYTTLTKLVRERAGGRRRHQESQLTTNNDQ